MGKFNGESIRRDDVLRSGLKIILNSQHILLIYVHYTFPGIIRNLFYKNIFTGRHEPK